MTVLAPGDPPPFERCNPWGSAPCLVVCDHASAAMPLALGALGLADAHRLEHIAWDIGAAWIARRLAQRLDAPALLAGYSRLVADCNRSPEDPAAFAETSDTIAIPGNRGLTGEARRARTLAVHRPYHDAIREVLDGFADNGVAPVLIAVHTMTPRMRGEDRRPEMFTVCRERGDRMAAPVLERMSATGGIITGDNSPYGLDVDEDFTVPEHAISRGLAYLQFEVRQDLVSREEDARRWADLVFDVVADLVADAGLRTPHRGVLLPRGRRAR